MVGMNLIYLIVALTSLAFARRGHIPLVLTRESREDIRAERREVAVCAWMLGGWALFTLKLLYDAQSLTALVVAAAVTAVATRTALDYVQLLRWVDQECQRET